MQPRRILLLAAIAAIAPLAGCVSNELEDTGGIRIARTVCPAVGIPAYTGDLTTFSPEQSRDQRAMDVQATITNLRTTCDDATMGETVTVATSFDVLATRASASGARDLTLPYFATVLRGGTRIVSKQLGQVTLHFADGQTRAQAAGHATAGVSRAAASLPEEVRSKLDRKRRPTDADASIDPMNDPSIKSAVAQASFELLIGFQLTQAQLAYNATR